MFGLITFELYTTTTMSNQIRPSLKSIAALAGVSTATVSRALRGLPGQSEETRQQIVKIAEDIGYTQHPLVAALMTDLRNKRPQKHSPRIALIHGLPWNRPIARNLETFRSSVYETARTLGYRVDELHLNEPGMTPRRIMSIIDARQISGAIFEHCWEPNVEMDIDLSEIAAVSVGFTLKRPNLHSIAPDHHCSTILAFQELRNRGYRKIGLAVPRTNESFTPFKRESALLGIHTNLPVTERIPMFDVDCGLEKRISNNYESKFLEWVRLYQPEAIMSNQLLNCELLRRHGYRIPDDIGFVHLGWHESDVQLAGIDPNWKKIGSEAVAKLVELICRSELGEPNEATATIVRGHWVNGASIRVGASSSGGLDRAMLAAV